ncbi:MAG: hypothetical protein A2091_10950 [Desulfuromonadales bacterium GWD2_61_12]|nr:MAG: hypothetical protein A2091_10950 [Desulfuromonadales bacterium GWD2_61_12]
MTMRVTTGNRRFGKGLRGTALVVALFFTWTLAGGATAAHAAKLAVNGTGSRGGEKQVPSAEERLESLVQAIETDLAAPAGDVEQFRQKLKTHREEIDTVDKEIGRELAATRKKLKAAKLPAEILNRHDAFVRHYESNVAELQGELVAIEGAKTPSASETARAKLRQHRERTKAPSRHQKLDPNNLPHRQPKAQKREPRQFKEEFDQDFKKDKHAWKNQKRIVVAATGSLTGLLGPAELAETIEVQLIPEIRAKALELGNDPLKIYEWVRNNVEYVPTWGSIQGAQLTLETKQGNAFDNASLLIALLRAAGIQARYVTGTIELPIDKIMNWNGGFTDPTAALEFMASGGVPIKAGMAGGRIVSARLEHVWVEAFIDYFPSRGARHKSGGEDTWISLDPSFKQYSFTNGIDLKTAVPFDVQTFVDQLKASATIDEAAGSVTGVNPLLVQQTLQDYQARVQSYIEQNHPGATVGDVLGKQAIVKQEYRYLLGTLPYKTAVKGATFAAIPDSYRHKLSFNVKNETADLTVFDPDAPEPVEITLNLTKSLPELAGKKITLSYAPATAQDEAVIASYLPKPHADGTPIQPSELPSQLPAYLIKVKPELRLDGQVVATGAPIGLGGTNIFTMTFSDPAYGSSQIVNSIDAGVYQAIGLNLGQISQGQLTTLKSRMEATNAKLESQNFAGLTKDDLMGDLFFTTALAYHAELNTMKIIAAKVMGVKAITLPSETVFATKLNVLTLWGIPRIVSPSGLNMDADYLMSVVKAKDGTKDRVVHYMLNTGVVSSSLEHTVPEHFFSTPEQPAEGVSTVKALRIANDQGIPIYTVNQGNVTAVMPQLQLDGQVKTDIKNAINAGKIVIVSKENINFHGWKGCGYIIVDPSTGAGAYMIGGGTSGCWVFIVIIALSIAFISAFAKSGTIGKVFSIAALFYAYNKYIDTVNEYIEKAESGEWTREKADNMVRVLSIIYISGAIFSFMSDDDYMKALPLILIPFTKYLFDELLIPLFDKIDNGEILK